MVSATSRNVPNLILNEQEAGGSNICRGREYEELATPATWKTAAQEFKEMGVKHVIITLAEKGAYFATHDGKKGKIDSVHDVDVKDTTGAGVSYITVFVGRDFLFLS